MARLQDFQTVTPGASDKILIIQSQGQGLAPHTIKMDSTNPTGTGALSLNRKANTTVADCSVAVGYNTEASGLRSFAEGHNTTASGDYSHAEGIATIASGDRSHAEGTSSTSSGLYSHAENQNTTASGQASHAEGLATIANHRSQHVFGEHNVADPSTAVATSRGNYVEIVGNGANTSTRSNARTLDWSGNEVLAGDLTYLGNISLSNLIRSYTFHSTAPLKITIGSYSSLIMIGFVQGVGAVALLAIIENSVVSVINMRTGGAWSNSHLTFSYSNGTLTASSDNAGTSTVTVIKGSI